MNMPSKTRKQARMMAACSHGAGYESCPSKKVAKEYNEADQKSGILKKAMMKHPMKTKSRGKK
jgi:hypothetical protein